MTVIAQTTPPAPFDGTLISPTGGELPPDCFGRFNETHPDEPAAVVRERFERDGYLYVKGLLRKENVVGLRKRFLQRE